MRTDLAEVNALITLPGREPEPTAVGKATVRRFEIRIHVDEAYEATPDRPHVQVGR